MKKLSILVSLLTLIAFCPSCKKDHSPCRPQKTPCPDGPRAVGMAVYPQGFQVDSYVFDVSIYYTYPGDDNTGKLDFWIGNKQYAVQSPLQHADSANLGASSFTIGLAVDSFTIRAVGYNTPQRCDCDPTISYTHFQTIPTSSSSKIIKLEEANRIKIKALNNITAMIKRNPTNYLKQNLLITIK
jgi:hypothetical protein